MKTLVCCMLCFSLIGCQEDAAQAERISALEREVATVQKEVAMLRTKVVEIQKAQRTTTNAKWSPAPALRRSQISSNEISAVASLVVMLAAQATFHKTDYYNEGKLQYARAIQDLYRCRGRLLRLITEEVARAGSAQSPAKGYFFVQFDRSATTGQYMNEIEFGYAAVPAKYGVSGVNTFIMDTGGSIYQKDTGGASPRVYPDPQNGWIHVD